MKIEIRTLQDTARLAQRLAALLKGRHALITLSGDLGAGKTTFTKALGKALGVTETINSPTFTIQTSCRRNGWRSRSRMARAMNSASLP